MDERARFLRIQRERIQSAEREISFMKEKMRAETNPGLKREYRKRRKRARGERERLERELRSAEADPAAPTGAEAGALPDFVVIGAQKGGTAFFYHLLTRHPLVAPAAYKEVHFFDRFYDLGAGWYRWRFPRPVRRDGRETITGEATPYYMFHPLAAGRMAWVVPGVRLISLLRNPVDRAYSHYQMQVRRGAETGTFEEALEAETTRLASADETPGSGSADSFEHRRFSYLSRGHYADQLLRFSEFFDGDQMLVLKSEDFFARPVEVLKTAQEFLGLPRWEPPASELQSGRHEGRYDQRMDQSTRRRLEAYFRPHNRRLYDHLGRDLGW